MQLVQEQAAQYAAVHNGTVHLIESNSFVVETRPNRFVRVSDAGVESVRLEYQPDESPPMKKEDTAGYRNVFERRINEKAMELMNSEPKLMRSDAVHVRLKLQHPDLWEAAYGDGENQHSAVVAVSLTDGLHLPDAIRLADQVATDAHVFRALER
jgi:hypothetical protein